MIPISYYILLSASIFSISLIGIFFNRRNLILILLCVELMLLASTINFVAFSAYQSSIDGQIIALFVFAVAAAETAIGLAILVVYYRLKSTVDVDQVSSLKG